MKCKLKYIFYILISMCIISFCMMNTENYIQAIAWSHFPTLILNNMFLVKEYFRVNEKNNMINTIVPRTRYKRFMKMAYIENVRNAILYSMYIHISLFILYSIIPQGYEIKIITFIFINTLVFIFEELLLTLQYFNKKNMLYLIVTVLINMSFHYLIVMKYLV